MYVYTFKLNYFLAVLKANGVKVKQKKVGKYENNKKDS